MRPTGLYAVYRGQEYRVSSVADTTVNLPCDLSELEAGSFPDEVARDRRPEPRWVKIPNRALDRLADVQVRGTWRGQSVSIMKVEGHRAALYFIGSPVFAEANGMTGDQYNGWGAWVPLDELSDVHEEIKELPR